MGYEQNRSAEGFLLLYHLRHDATPFFIYLIQGLVEDNNLPPNCTRSDKYGFP